MARSIRLTLAWLTLAPFLALPALAQTSIVPGQSPPSGAGTGTVESQPLAPPPGTAPPAAAPEQKPAESAQPATPASPPAVPPAAAPPPAAPPVVAAKPVDPNATLAGKPGDSGNVDDLTLVARPAAMTGGRSSWDDGAKNLAAAFTRMRGEIEKAGAKVAGRPFAIFVETDDNAFRFEAFLPIDAAPAGRDSFSAETRIAQTPDGRALRFIHQGPYDDVDSTYEAITAYLDAKGINVRDAFIEEYVGELKDSADAKFEVNIYVQPR
jgi:effector-binding domain-containing protein